jgi:hypothetical protein
MKDSNQFDSPIFSETKSIEIRTRGWLHRQCGDCRSLIWNPLSGRLLVCFFREKLDRLIEENEKRSLGFVYILKTKEICCVWCLDCFLYEKTILTFVEL